MAITKETLTERVRFLNALWYTDFKELKPTEFCELKEEVGRLTQELEEIKGISALDFKFPRDITQEDIESMYQSVLKLQEKIEPKLK